MLVSLSEVRFLLEITTSTNGEVGRVSPVSPSDTLPVSRCVTDDLYKRTEFSSVELLTSSLGSRADERAWVRTTGLSESLCGPLYPKQYQSGTRDEDVDYWRKDNENEEGSKECFKLCSLILHSKNPIDSP